MRRLIFLLSLLAAGTALGLASAWYAIAVNAGTPVAYGAWDINPLVGSAAAGPYDRARIARHALLGLTRDEAVYYVAGRDSEGRALSAEHSYRITGGELPARWWSITAYGGDFFLIPNDEGRYSFNSETVSRDADGRFSITVSASPHPGDWLPLGDARHFDLFLRLYNPNGEPDESRLPRIERIPADE